MTHNDSLSTRYFLNLKMASLDDTVIFYLLLLILKTYFQNDIHCPRASLLSSQTYQQNFSLDSIFLEK